MSATLSATQRFLDGIQDIDNVIERIALGPQEEVLDKFNQLNSRFGTDFRCTPTFRWAPGFYKKLKEEAGRLSNITIQKNKVSTYANQIQNGRWYVDAFMTKIQEIDNKLYYLRNSGICFQDNTDDVNRVLGEYIETISNTIDIARETYPNMNISIYHGMHTESRDRSAHAVTFHIFIENVNTNINIGGETVNVPMGDIDIIIAVDLIKNIMNRIRNTSRYSQGNVQSSHSSRWNGGIFHSQEENILFPYVGRNSWTQALEVNFAAGQNTPAKFSNICFGDYVSEIVEAAWYGDILALFTYLNIWTESFNVGRTGPLNGFDRMFHGIWPEMTSEIWESSGRIGHTSRIDNCHYVGTLEETQPAQDESYCDRYECILRNNCPAYQAMYIPPEAINDGGELTDQDGERTLTEAEILEMYRGVNTVDISTNPF